MSSSTIQSWAIVGGGMLGLTLALELSKQGRRVTIFESATELGGLSSAWQLATNAGETITWDRHYHVTLLSDLALRNVLQQIGLENELNWVVTRTGVFSNGKLYSVSNSKEFLLLPTLGLLDKLRLGATIFYGSKIRDWKELEKIPVSDWLTRLSGKRTFEKFWLPLLRSKLGENYRITSAAFIWTTIARLYAARRSGMKRELFGYVPGGYARILNCFAEYLKQRGITIKINHAVTKVSAEADRQIQISFASGQQEHFDNVIITAPGSITAQLCPQLTDEEKQQLKGVRYQGIICASLLLRQSLADFYVTNLTDDGLPFTGVIEMSTLVDRKEFGGHALVYLPKYVSSDDDAAFAQSDDDIRESFLTALERMYPHFRRDDVLAFRLSRVRNVFPLPTLHYSERVPQMITTLPGVFVVNSSQILNGTLNVNETVQLAVNAAARLV